MKLKTILVNKYILWAALVLSGFILGRVMFHNKHEEKTVQEETTQESKTTIWTCAMHPQIRIDHPGNCPICGMKLIPLVQETAPLNPDAIVMTDEGIKLAEVQTSIVSRQKPARELHLYGKIQADERLIQTQPAHVPGRIEKLLVNFTGEEVQKGQAIAQIYSPDLVTAQEELREAVKMKELQPQILAAAREKLHQWKLTDSQISDLESTGTIQNLFDVYSTVSGIVISRDVNVGDYVSQGTPLFEIADLSHVWALFDAYESDLPWIRKGDRISFTLESQPGREYSGTISFIDPVINPQTRVARIRVEIPNKGNSLKPEMFATGTLNARLTTKGESLVIPQSAVLWTGTRSLVYIKIQDTKEPTFISREITIGPALGNSYVVLAGLMEGEEIVTNGTFSVDASAQLNGKPSMMNPGGGKTSSMPGMIMPGDSRSDAQQTSGEPEKNNEKLKAPEQSGKLNVSMDFIMQLNTVYHGYIALKNAFVNSDSEEVKLAAGEVQADLTKIDMNLLKGDAMMQWMNLLPTLGKQIKQIHSSEDIEEQRKIFSLFNVEFYKTIKYFGLMGETVYYQFCPMANNSAGAFWLSETNDIRNPYFGESMLTCGETIETLKY